MMKILSFLLLLLFCLNTIVFAQDIQTPQEPSAPEVNDTKLPDITPPDYIAPKESSSLYLIKGWLTYSHGTFTECVLEMSNSIQLSITNNQNGSLSITSLPIYEIDSIMITSWKGIKTNDDYYCFLPNEYRLYTNQGVTNYILFQGNIPSLNTIQWSGDKGRTTSFSMFFDRWVAGKKGNFRWENSRSGEFNFNQTHPLPNVVVGIRLDKNY